jgi:hypothetical protein
MNENVNSDQSHDGKCRLESAPPSKSKQFNFARHWRTKIVPHLDNPGVVGALTLGLKLYDIDYNEGDPPWLCGRGQWNGQRVKEGCLSWYQPWGRCHYIAPFCWALAQKLFPDRKCGIVSSDWHSVVTVWSDDREQPELVMDILLFRDGSAQDSLDFVKQREWKLYDSLPRYLASFFDDPAITYAGFAEIIRRYEADLQSSV